MGVLRFLSFLVLLSIFESGFDNPSNVKYQEQILEGHSDHHGVKQHFLLALRRCLIGVRSIFENYHEGNHVEEQ
jgi:hypothetical protein